MIHLRKAIIYLVLALIVFYNLERLDIGRSNALDISSFVYVLAMICVLGIVRLRRLSRIRPGVLAGTAVSGYLLFRIWLSVFEGNPWNSNIYLFITEIASLLILVWLSYAVVERLKDFEEAVANITLSHSARSPKLIDESVQEIRDNMYLSRRYGRPLSLAVLECDRGSVKIMLNHCVQEVQRAMMSRYVAAGMARILDQELRRVDLMLQDQGTDRFIILCPETGSVDLNAAVDRIRKTAEKHLGVTVNCGTASFPDSALTFEELVSRAEQQLILSRQLSLGAEDKKLHIKRGSDNGNSKLQSTELRGDVAAGGETGP